MNGQVLDMRMDDESSTGTATPKVKHVMYMCKK